MLSGRLEIDAFGYDSFRVEGSPITAALALFESAGATAYDVNSDLRDLQVGL